MRDQVRTLKARIDYFFRTDRKGRTPVSDFVSKLLDFSDVSIFGGMLRDLIIEGNRTFKSDVDLVLKIHPDQRKSLEFLLSLYPNEKNKFGGFRLQIGEWKIDLWELENTWALRNGIVSGKDFSALLDTTFFNWDAIAYDLKKNEILYKENYFESLEFRLLDINLAKNPNLIGTYKRILKHLMSNQAKLTPTLVDFYISNYELVSSHLIEKNTSGDSENVTSIYGHLLNEMIEHTKKHHDEVFQLQRSFPSFDSRHSIASDRVSYE